MQDILSLHNVDGVAFDLKMAKISKGFSEREILRPIFPSCPQGHMLINITNTKNACLVPVYF